MQLSQHKSPLELFLSTLEHTTVQPSRTHDVRMLYLLQPSPPGPSMAAGAALLAADWKQWCTTGACYPACWNEAQPAKCTILCCFLFVSSLMLLTQLRAIDGTALHRDPVGFSFCPLVAPAAAETSGRYGWMLHRWTKLYFLAVLSKRRA